MNIHLLFWHHFILFWHSFCQRRATAPGSIALQVRDRSYILIYPGPSVCDMEPHSDKGKSRSSLGIDLFSFLFFLLLHSGFGFGTVKLSPEAREFCGRNILDKRCQWTRAPWIQSIVIVDIGGPDVFLLLNSRTLQRTRVRALHPYTSLLTCLLWHSGGLDLLKRMTKWQLSNQL